MHCEPKDSKRTLEGKESDIRHLKESMEVGYEDKKPTSMSSLSGTHTEHRENQKLFRNRSYDLNLPKSLDYNTTLPRGHLLQGASWMLPPSTQSLNLAFIPIRLCTIRGQGCM